mmetsp:Transcript_105900/g.316271  ORF Transcript_105900/g.316271 Transcript_105900/m.316271 type:complete len:320 (-) Transcript_105900:730-1689(-)
MRRSMHTGMRTHKRYALTISNHQVWSLLPWWRQSTRKDDPQTTQFPSTANRSDESAAQGTLYKGFSTGQVSAMVRELDTTVARSARKLPMLAAQDSWSSLPPCISNSLQASAADMTEKTASTTEVREFSKSRTQAARLKARLKVSSCPPSSSPASLSPSKTGSLFELLLLPEVVWPRRPLPTVLRLLPTSPMASRAPPVRSTGRRWAGSGPAANRRRLPTSIGTLLAWMQLILMACPSVASSAAFATKPSESAAQSASLIDGWSGLHVSGIVLAAAATQQSSLSRLVAKAPQTRGSCSVLFCGQVFARPSAERPTMPRE